MDIMADAPPEQDNDQANISDRRPEDNPPFMSQLDLLTKEFATPRLEPRPPGHSGPRRALSHESGLHSSQPELPLIDVSNATLSAQAMPFEPFDIRKTHRSAGSNGSTSSLPVHNNWPSHMYTQTSPRATGSPIRSSNILGSSTRRAETFSHSRFQRRSRPAAYDFAQGDANGALQQSLFDPYVTSTSPLPTTHHPHQSQLNPYAQDPTNGASAQYYQPNSYQQPLQYHLYAPLGPHRVNLMPFQRAAHDFFIPDALREDLQKKSAASHQTLPSRLKKSASLT